MACFRMVQSCLTQKYNEMAHTSAGDRVGVLSEAILAAAVVTTWQLSAFIGTRATCVWTGAVLGIWKYNPIIIHSSFRSISMLPFQYTIERVIHTLTCFTRGATDFVKSRGTLTGVRTRCIFTSIVQVAARCRALRALINV